MHEIAESYTNCTLSNTDLGELSGQLLMAVPVYGQPVDFAPLVTNKKMAVPLPKDDPATETKIIFSPAGARRLRGEDSGSPRTEWNKPQHTGSALQNQKSRPASTPWYTGSHAAPGRAGMFHTGKGTCRRSTCKSALWRNQPTSYHHTSTSQLCARVEQGTKS
jgi:hypothetical protein